MEILPAGNDLPPRAVGALVILVCLVEFWAVCGYFPSSGWLDRNPFFSASYALHFARALISADSLNTHLRVWTYSPYLMAGYPAATRTEPMGDLPGLCLWLVRWLLPAHAYLHGAAIVYKVLVVGLIAAAAPAMVLAAVCLGLGGSTVVVAAALGVFGIFNVPGIEMMRAGMFAYFAASSLSVAAAALVYVTGRRGHSWHFPLLGLLGGLLTWLHPLAAPMLLPPAAAALLCTAGRRRTGLLLAGAIALIVALPWLMPIVLTAQTGVSFSHWWRTPTSVTGTLALLYHPRLPFAPVLVLAAACYGVLRLRVERVFRAGWGATLVSAFGVGYFGSMVPILRPVEPARFEACFYFYAVPPAALAVCEIWGRLRNLRRAGLPLRAFAIMAAVFYTLASMAMSYLDRHYNGVFQTRLPAQAREIENWLTVLGNDSRVMLEAGTGVRANGEILLPYFGSDLGLLWAWQTDAELIGGSPSEGFSQFSFVNFSRSSTFGRKLSDWSPQDFDRQLMLYNVGTLITWSEAAKAYLSQVPNVSLLQESAPFALFGVAGVHSYLLAGSARRVRARPDCIEITAAAPGRIVLKYHYFKTLRAAPAIPLRPVAVGNGDPVGFIEADNDAPRNLRIYNAGFTGWGGAHAACR